LNTTSSFKYSFEAVKAVTVTSSIACDSVSTAVAVQTKRETMRFLHATAECLRRFSSISIRSTARHGFIFIFDSCEVANCQVDFDMKCMKVRDGKQGIKEMT
jgi:hypothetical protein